MSMFGKPMQLEIVVLQMPMEASIKYTRRLSKIAAMSWDGDL